MGNKTTTPSKKASKRKSVLSGNDVPAIVRYIQSKRCRNIVLMLGAGVSTSAGIPDFRSPDTGLYANLARLNLPYPESVFEINFFRTNPVPFYTLAKELYPGKFRPTLAHAFVRLLSERHLLHMCFTQNIDTLERRAGVPDSKIIEAHGSFAHQHCINCGTPFDDDKMKECVSDGSIPICGEKGCGGYVKPDIVFFGESLPKEFLDGLSKLETADLLIVMGTSLTVHPFASLVGMVGGDCPRVLINIERVGDFGSRPDDVVLLGKCDDVVKDMCESLGWHKQLLKLWHATKDGVEVEVDVETEEAQDSEETSPTDLQNDIIHALADNIGRKLVLNPVTNRTAQKPNDETVVPKKFTPDPSTSEDLSPDPRHLKPTGQPEASLTQL